METNGEKLPLLKNFFERPLGPSFLSLLAYHSGMFLPCSLAFVTELKSEFLCQSRRPPGFADNSDAELRLLKVSISTRTCEMVKIFTGVLGLLVFCLFLVVCH